MFLRTRRLIKFCITIAGVMGLLYFLLAEKTVQLSYSDIISSDLPVGEKQRGAHLFRMGASTNLQKLQDYNLEWITLVPWAYQNNWDSSEIDYYFGKAPEQIAQRDSNWMERIRRVQEAGFKVFLKPHVWLDAPDEGKWRSDIFTDDVDAWEAWKGNYREFILHYARLAERGQVEMFCVGTEFSRLSLERPEFWEQLIEEVRAVYSGKLTYAANWYKEYDELAFWGQLDYIGVQAYFPLVKKNAPTVDEISKGWKKYLPELEAVSRKYGKPILFTELGYKSTVDSAAEPWSWLEYTEESEKRYSLETQANCYQAFFDSVWEREWFAGAHFWQLQADHTLTPERRDLDFTPQGKPAAQVMTEGFSRSGQKR